MTKPKDRKIKDQAACIGVLREVWTECVSAKDDRLIFAGDDSKGCRPRISEQLMAKIYDALSRLGYVELPYGTKRTAKALPIPERGGE